MSKRTAHQKLTAEGFSINTDDITIEASDNSVHFRLSDGTITVRIVEAGASIDLSSMSALNIRPKATNSMMISPG